MKKYIVIALSVGGLGNKVHKSGAPVTEKNFPEGHAEELVKKGFLKPDGETEEPAKKDVVSNEAVIKFEKLMKVAADKMNAGEIEEAQKDIDAAAIMFPDSEWVKKFQAEITKALEAKAAIDAHDNGTADKNTFVDDGIVKKYDEVSEDEIRAILKIRGVDFNENSKKKYLYTLYCKK